MSARTQIPWLPVTVSAEAGNADAAFYLAYCYSRGWGVEKDPEDAQSWYAKAAEKGVTESALMA